MEMIEKFRREETRRLLEWIGNNQEEWFEITLAFVEEDMLIESELKEVFRNLKNNGFYQLLVLLMYTKNEIIGKALEKSMLHIICNNWNEQSIDTMFDMLIDNISQAAHEIV